MRISARKPGRRVRPRARSPARDEPAVLVDERDDIGDRGEADEVELAAQELRVGAQQRLAELVDDAGSAQPGEGIVGGARRHDRAVGKALSRAVMVGDDHVQPELLGLGHLAGGGDAAVDRQHERAAVRRQPLEHAGIEPVALVEAARQSPAHLGAELPEHVHGQHRRRDSVDVVVAVHADLLACRDSCADPLDRLGHVAERERVVPRRLGLQKCARPLGVGEAAANEHGSGELAQPELACELLHLARVDGLDRPASLLHGRRKLCLVPDGARPASGSVRRVATAQGVKRGKALQS